MLPVGRHSELSLRELRKPSPRSRLQNAARALPHLLQPALRMHMLDRRSELDPRREIDDD